MKSGDQAKDDPAGGKAEGDKEEPDAKRQKTDAKPHVPRSWSFPMGPSTFLTTIPNPST